MKGSPVSMGVLKRESEIKSIRRNEVDMYRAAKEDLYPASKVFFVIKEVSKTQFYYVLGDIRPCS